MDAVANLAVDVLNQKEILPTMADIRETLSNNYQPTISSSYDEGNSSSNSSSESNEEKGGKQEGYDKKDDDDKKSSKKRKRAPKTTPETTEARRESHKIIEQKRRQKINEKINELRELLNYPDGTQNKAVVLQAAVDNIRNLKVLCAKLLASHRQLQEDYVQVVHENERLKKIIPPTLRPPGTTPPMASPISNFPSTIAKPQNANAAPNQPQPSTQNPSLFNELRSSGPTPPDWTFVYDENQNPSSNNQLIQQYQQAMAQRGGNPSLFQSQQAPNIPMPNPSPMQNLSQPQFGLFSSSGGNPNLGYNSIEALARTLFTEGNLGSNLPLPISNQMPPQSQTQQSVGGQEGSMQPSDQFESH